MPIREFLKDGGSFEPNDITAMSAALEEVCKAMGLRDQMTREVVAARIIQLARQGERDPARLRDLALYETGIVSDTLANTKGVA